VWSALAINPASGAELSQAPVSGARPVAPQDFLPSPVCPDRPLYVQPTQATVKDTGLSLEVLCIVGGTFLERDLPGPGEDADLLRRYLEEPPYAGLTDEAYVDVMKEAVQMWPGSRFSHAGLARAILSRRREATIDEKRQAASAYLKAAEIAFTDRRVRYASELAQLLGDLGDRGSMHAYLNRALRLIPDEQARFVLYLEFGRALAQADDRDAEGYLQKAIAIQPEGTWGAYEVYVTFLMERGRPQDVLNLLSPALEARNLIEPSYLHTVRCRALARLGRQAEAQAECQRALDLLPFRVPGPAGIPAVRAEQTIQAGLLAQTREPPARWDFGHLAEGLTSANAGGPIEAGYRMFSVPDVGEVCGRARADDVTRLRPSSSRLRLQVGTPFRLSSLRIDAIGKAGGLLPKVPIAIEGEMAPDILDGRSDRIAFGNVTPVKAGTVRLRIRTICNAPGAETFITAEVTS
jgi:tetratricopeptide (TPR) repeat protein